MNWSLLTHAVWLSATIVNRNVRRAACPNAKGAPPIGRFSFRIPRRYLPYNWTLSAVRWAREIGLPVQINTTITRHNLKYLDSIIGLLEQLDIVLWSVFFLVPTGRGSAIDLISAEEFELVFEKLYETSRRVAFDIKSTEAQHYRRFLLQRRTEAKHKGNGHSLSPSPGTGTPDGIGRAPRGINDGKGFVFISHLGEVFPSGFLPISVGNVRKQSLTELYRHSPLFVALRDSSNLKGKCGICEFREICGGSRARAYALTEDPFAEEPCCTWQPKSRSAAGHPNCLSAAS
jgi:AdoMet-dependent heme synthase